MVVEEDLPDWLRDVSGAEPAAAEETPVDAAPPGETSPSYWRWLLLVALALGGLLLIVRTSLRRRSGREGASPERTTSERDAFERLKRTIKTGSPGQDL